MVPVISCPSPYAKMLSQTRKKMKCLSHQTLVSFIFKFYWSTVDLQCCVNVCCTAKWFSDTWILFHILFHYGLSQDIEYNSLLYRRTLLFIYSLSNSLHLLIPNSQYPPPTLVTISLFFLSVKTCFLRVTPSSSWYLQLSARKLGSPAVMKSDILNSGVKWGLNACLLND